MTGPNRFLSSRVTRAQAQLKARIHVYPIVAAVPHPSEKFPHRHASATVDGAAFSRDEPDIQRPARLHDLELAILGEFLGPRLAT